MLAALTICVSATPVRADQAEALDADFLDYLLKYEGKDDNWTVVTDGKLPDKAKPVAVKAPAPPAAPKPQKEVKP